MNDVGETQRILLIYNSIDKASVRLVHNARAALRDARLEHDLVDFSNALHLPALERYTSILLCAEALDELGVQGIVDLSDYVADGGGLVLLRRTWHPQLAAVAGMVPLAVQPDILSSPEADGGLVFIADTLPPFVNVSVNSDELAGHCPFHIRPARNVHLIATSEQGFPLAWLNRFGSGRTICWNSAFLHNKRMRGVIIQSAMAVQQVGVLPLANVAIIQVDDFPAPLEHGDLSVAGDEYAGLSSMEFYICNWHPDMQALADRHGVVLSYFPTFNYNDVVAGPFSFKEWSNAKITINGARIPACVHAAKIASHGGEIGLHGYNHVPLIEPFWSSETAIQSAMDAVTSQWQRDGLGPLPSSYVPPNNEYDAHGLGALCGAMPNIKVISGSFLHVAPERGGQREFGEEPWNPQLFCVPRATSGYEFSREMQFDGVSQLATSGIWTHFVHADDVFDVSKEKVPDPICRNPQNRPWRSAPSRSPRKRGLLEEFDAWLVDFRRRFPWLRFESTSNGAKLIKQHLQQEWTISLHPSWITIETDRGRYFQIHLNDGRLAGTRCISGADLIVREHLNGSTSYTLRAQAHTVTVPLLTPAWPRRIIRRLRCWLISGSSILRRHSPSALLHR